jgi:hypothetical protein
LTRERIKLSARRIFLLMSKGLMLILRWFKGEESEGMGAGMVRAPVQRF